MTPNSPKRLIDIIHELWVNCSKILLPPLHIKLGLIEQFVKALDTDEDTFKYICRLFPSLTIEKLRADIFCRSSNMEVP